MIEEIAPSKPNSAVVDCGGCLENFSRGGHRYRFKVYPITESLNPLGKPINGIVPPPLVEVVRSQLVIWFSLENSTCDPHRVSSACDP